MRYGFTEAQNGGFVQFNGVMSSDKEAESIDVDKDAGTVTVTFTDSSVYEYSAEVEETDTGFRITNETDRWTPPTQNNS